MNPNIEGKIYNFLIFEDSGYNGSLYIGNLFDVNVGLTNGNTSWGSIAFDSSKSNNLYGKSLTVQPESLRVHYIIKYMSP